MTGPDYTPLRDWLTMIRDFKHEHGAGRTPEGDMLDHGEWFPWSPLPEGVEYGEAKNCYGNAAMLAIGTDQFGADDERGRYVYVEGYAVTPELGLVVEHAWCIDTHNDDRVVDNTWRHGGSECGFCDGTGQREQPLYDENGDEDGYIEDAECVYCNGSGEAGHEHPLRDTTVYVGIRVPTDLLAKTIHERGHYTYIAGPEDVDAALATRAS